MGQLLRFSLVGVVNTLVGLLCIWGAMYFLGFNEIVANLVGYAVGLVLSFALNRAWTFADRGSVAGSLPRWVALAGAAYLLNLGIVVAAHRLAGVDPYLAQLLGIGAYTAVMFVGSRTFVFRDPRSSGAA